MSMNSKKKVKISSTQTKDFPSVEEQETYRIITKNWVYIIGLSDYLADKDLLIQEEYWGQYGNIIKIVINKSKAYNSSSIHGPSYAGYITYSKPSEAAIAILALDNTIVNHHLIRASFGTTKYCSKFWKGKECPNKNCVYSHKRANEADIIKKDSLKSNIDVFYKQQLYAIKIADLFSDETRNKLTSNKVKSLRAMWPTPDLIYKSEIVRERDPMHTKQSQENTSIRTETNIYKNSKKNSDICFEKGSKTNIDKNTSWTNGNTKNNSITLNPSDNSRKSNNSWNTDINNNTINSLNNINSPCNAISSTASKKQRHSKVSEDTITNNNTLNSILKKNNDFQIDKIIPHDMETFTTRSTTMNSKDDNFSEVSTLCSGILSKNSFDIKEKSRHNFVMSENPNIINTIKIPNYISNILSKASKMWIWTKHYKDNQNINDAFLYKDIICENQYEDSCSHWAEIVNKRYNRNKGDITQGNLDNSVDLSDEIEQINKFIYHKINNIKSHS